jgi:hypothetical protein
VDHDDNGPKVLLGDLCTIRDQRCALFVIADRQAETEASLGDGVGAFVLRVVPIVLFPATAALMGLVVYHWTRGKLFEASLAMLVCALALEVVATLWMAAGSVIPCSRHVVRPTGFV